MFRATTRRPVPGSPQINTLARVAAARDTRSSTLRIAGE